VRPVAGRVEGGPVTTLLIALCLLLGAICWAVRT
jgi:hypothetical protein